MKPNAAEKYNPSTKYIAELIASTGMTQIALARCLGVSERTIRKWISGERPASYLVQFALECLVLLP